MAGAGSETAPAFVVGGGRGTLEYMEHCSCIECLISAADVCLRINGVVGRTARFAGAVLVWIAGAICTSSPSRPHSAPNSIARYNAATCTACSNPPSLRRRFTSSHSISTTSSDSVSSKCCSLTSLTSRAK